MSGKKAADRAALHTVFAASRIPKILSGESLE